MHQTRHPSHKGDETKHLEGKNSVPLHRKIAAFAFYCPKVAKRNAYSYNSLSAKKEHLHLFIVLTSVEDEKRDCSVGEEILFCVSCSKVRPDKRTLANDA